MHLTEQELAKLLKSNPDLGQAQGVETQQVKPPKKLSAKSQLEEKFLVLWTHLKGPALEREYRFDPTRRYRIDFFHPLTNTGIELEGGTWQYGKSRHSSPQGYSADCLKYNLAAMQGLVILRLTSDMVSAPYLETLITYLERKIYVNTRPDED